MDFPPNRRPTSQFRDVSEADSAGGVDYQQHAYTPVMPARQRYYPAPHAAPHPFRPPIRYVRNPMESPTISAQVHPNTILVRQGGIRLSKEEKAYLDEVDANKPLLANLSACVIKNSIDVGKTGLVLLKYELSGVQDPNVYEECVRVMSNHCLSVPANTSSLGELCPRVFQYGSSFLTNVTTRRQENQFCKLAKPRQTMFYFNPLFRHSSLEFRGSHPFKGHVLVSTHNKLHIPTDIQRAISSVIRQVLSQIFETADAHKMFSYRIDFKNQKTDHEDLPNNVVQFVVDFCLQCFGYGPKIRFASYNLENLCIDYPALASKLGESSIERAANYDDLVADVHKFEGIVCEKLQRLLNDLRKSTIRLQTHTSHGEVFTTADFVPDSKKQKEVIDQQDRHMHDERIEGN